MGGERQVARRTRADGSGTGFKPIAKVAGWQASVLYKI